MQNQPKNPFDPKPKDTIHPTLLALGLSVMVYLRTNLGYRLMQKPHLLGPVLYHGIFGYFILTNVHLPPGERQGGLAMLVFAAGMLVLNGIHVRRGWRLAFRETNPVHTMSLGDSICRTSPLFRLLRLQRCPQAALVFELCGLVFAGIYLLQSLHWYLFGWWLIAAAIGMALVEATAHTKMQNQVLDLRDSRIDLQYHLHEEERAIYSLKRAKKQPRRASTVATLAPELDATNRDRKSRSRWG